MRIVQSRTLFFSSQLEYAYRICEGRSLYPDAVGCASRCEINASADVDILALGLNFLLCKCNVVAYSILIIKFLQNAINELKQIKKKQIKLVRTNREVGNQS